MEGSDSVFDFIDRIYYSLHKVTVNRGGLYIKYKK